MHSDVIMVSPAAVRRLHVAQSVLSGLQTLTAASVLSDIVGPKYAALLIVVVAAAQQSVSSYMSKAVGEAATKMETTVSDAQAVTQQVATVAGLGDFTATDDPTKDNPHGR